MVKAKIYINHYHDKALIVNDNNKTITITKATDLKYEAVAFYYKTTLARMREVAKIALARGYLRA